MNINRFGNKLFCIKCHLDDNHFSHTIVWSSGLEFHLSNNILLKQLDIFQTKDKMLALKSNCYHDISIFVWSDICELIQKVVDLSWLDITMNCVPCHYLYQVISKMVIICLENRMRFIEWSPFCDPAMYWNQIWFCERCVASSDG